MLRWYDKRDVGYIVGLAKNQVLTRLAGDLTEQAEREFKLTGQKQRLFGQFHYAAKTWDQSRRVIVKAEHLEQGPNTRFVVTNLDGAPQMLYDDLYCQHGDMENRIKEQQLHLFADRTSCHEFLPNKLRVLFSAAAYVLVERLRSMYLKGTELADAQVQKIRLDLFKVAARVTYSVRRVVFHLCSSYPYQELFLRIVHRLKPALNPSLEFR